MIGDQITFFTSMLKCVRCMLAALTPGNIVD